MTPILDALTGPDRGIRAAWLMGRASYAYTRSWHGAEGPDGEPMDFGRWYAFRCAVKTGLSYLWRK